MATSSATPPGAFMRFAVISLVDSRLSEPAPVATDASVRANAAYTTACRAALIFFPTFFLVGRCSKSKMASLACQMASATQAAKAVQSSNGPAGCTASCSTAPLTSAWPWPPMASRIATSPMRKCSSPDTANPARATTSRGFELVTSSATSAASFISRLMIVSLVLPSAVRSVIVSRQAAQEQMPANGPGVPKFCGS